MERKKPINIVIKAFHIISQKQGASYTNVPDLRHKADMQYSKGRRSITLCCAQGSSPYKHLQHLNVPALLKSLMELEGRTQLLKINNFGRVWSWSRDGPKWCNLAHLTETQRATEVSAVLHCLASYSLTALYPKTLLLWNRNKDWCHWCPISKKLTQPGVHLHLHNFTDSSRIYSSQSLCWEE